MKTKIKLSKPTLTTHRELIGNLCYILINKIFKDIIGDLLLDDKNLIEFIEHGLYENIKIEYKIINKYRNLLI